MKKILLVLSLSILFISNQVLACGILLSELGTNVRADNMKIALMYEEKSNTEELIVNINYLVNEGEVSQFGWLMPFPSQPSVVEAPSDIFSVLENETTPKKNFIQSLKDKTKYIGSKGINSKGSITVLEEKEVGAFDISIVKASDTQTLLKWAEENNFNIPWIDTGILDKYIQKDWTFVLMKLKDNGTSGDINPMKFTFKTEKAIFPIELTKYGKDGSYAPTKTIPLTVYLIGNEKMKPSTYSMDYLYGGTISDETMKKLNSSNKDMNQITKYSYEFNGSDIKDELIFITDKSIDNYNDGSLSTSEKVLLGTIIFVPFLLFVFIFKLYKSQKNKNQ